MSFLRQLSGNLQTIWTSAMRSRRITRTCWLFLSFWIIIFVISWATRLSIERVQDFLINEQYISPQSSWTNEEKIVYDGRKIMHHTNVTFLGVGRDLGPGLPKVLRQIEVLAKEFAYSRAIFVEGNSTDNSPAILKSWAGKSAKNRTIVTMPSVALYETLDNPKIKGKPLSREGRLAIARNVALKELHKLPPTEYIIIVDLDVLGWDMNGVADSFGRRDWDVICANGILVHGVYRDTYAFRTKELNTNHHWAGGDHGDYNITDEQSEKYREMVKHGQRTSKAMMDFSSANQDILSVTSCFGGLAIYRYDSIVGCEYSHRHHEPPHMLDCEHVLFHECMIQKNKARIFSNSNMKLWYGHSPFEELTWDKVYNHFFNSRRLRRR